MPDTTPRPKETAKTFTQNLYKFLYWGLPVRSHSNSSRASQLARPMVKAGKMMWKKIVNANWMRERSSVSNCMAFSSGHPRRRDVGGWHQARRTARIQSRLTSGQALSFDTQGNAIRHLTMVQGLAHVFLGWNALSGPARIRSWLVDLLFS